MEIINRRQRIMSLARKVRRENKTIGFVPTMGALHEGHLRLVSEARQMCDVVIVSIFVNPTQFNDPKDLEKYPRDLTADAAVLTEYGVDYVFTPGVEEIYPPGASTFVTVEGIADTLEGISRPGHFRGVATVVTILFNMIRPDFAFFGQKDAQQVLVVKKMTLDLGFETEIVVVPTLREENGLAMSSRNELLTPQEREKATVIFQGLKDAKIAYRDGERNALNLEEIVRQKIAEEPLAVIDYIAVVEAETLAPIQSIENQEVLVAVAVRFGSVRLIDNTILNRKQ